MQLAVGRFKQIVIKYQMNYKFINLMFIAQEEEVEVDEFPVDPEVTSSKLHSYSLFFLSANYDHLNCCWNPDRNICLSFIAQASVLQCII